MTNSLFGDDVWEHSKVGHRQRHTPINILVRQTTLEMEHGNEAVRENMLVLTLTPRHHGRQTCSRRSVIP